MDNQDKTLIQSYKFTTVRNNIGIYGQRLLLRIVEAVQEEMEGLTFKNGKDVRKIDVKTETNLFGEKEFTMPLSSIMKSENLTQSVKDDIRALAFSAFDYEDGDTWITAPFFAEVEIKKGTRVLRAVMRPIVWEALMDYSKGFRKFSLDKAMAFKSAYSLRFYQLMSLQTEPISYSLDELRKMFALEHRYQKTKDFIKNTIVKAKEELDSCSPYTFDWQPVYSRTTKSGRPSITSIRFIPRYQRRFETTESELQNIEALSQNVTLNLSRAQEQRLIKTFEITHKGLMNNRRIFNAALKNLDFDTLIDKIARRVSNLRPKNPAGYLVRALKEELIGEGINV